MHASVRTWSGRLVAKPWLLSFVPINAATSGFAVVLPLLILIPLHGTWADVAVAATLYNAAVILSSIAWGHLLDLYRVRRLFLVLNYAGFAALYAVLATAPSLFELFAIYTVVGALAPAGASASNLLILEKFSEAERPTAFASFQEMSMLGSIAGLLVGYFWTLQNEALLALLFVLAALALASAGAVAFGISEPRRTLPGAAVVHHPEGLLSHLRPSVATHTPVPFFPHRPRLAPHPIRRLVRWAREELRHELPLILLGGFLFNLSSNLFNISYTPYLYSAGLAATSIFLVNLSNNTAQTFVFPITGPLANRLGADRLVQRATYVRGIGYLATAGFAFLALSRSQSFGSNFAVFAVLGAAIAVYTTASSLMLFRALQGRDAGSLLGVNSALGGGAAVAGAGLSALLSAFGSFALVFFVSGGILLASLPLWTSATLAYGRRKHGTTAPAVPAAGRTGAPAVERAGVSETT